MSKNNPNEVILDPKSFLVSETDINGLVKFANSDFCKYSEYSLDELLGEPHNIVRHRDMPRAAFKDLWATVKAGKIWKGFVKNATKSGKFYWVFATIYPFKSCDGSAGYISCRKKASESEIIKYTELYKTMAAQER